MAAVRTATVTWSGDLASGAGSVSAGSSDTFTDLPVSWASRTEDAEGRTSPEELLAAAHASCYAMAFSGDLARQLRTVIEEIIRGPATGLLPTLSPQARVVEVFVTARGIAYVSLSKEATQDMPGGSKAELLTVYSLVNTVVANFPAVARVQLLVEDRPVDSFAGHIDVSRPLLPDMTLLALPSPSPVASASPMVSPAP